MLIFSGCTSTIRGSELSLEYYNLGNAYYDLADYDKSILYYQKALSIDSENKKAYFNLAMALIGAGRPGEAQGVLEGLISQDPNNQNLLEALAFSYHAQGDNVRAIEIYRRILEATPANNKVRYNLGMLLWKEEQREAALDAFSTILENDPEDLDALYNRGELLLELGRIEEAAGVFEAYLQSQPDSADAYMHLADAYRIQERYDKALEAYAQALAYDEKRVEAWFSSAVIQLTKIEDPERGLTALSEALEGGFKNQEAIAELLADPQLLERDRVKDLLQRSGLLPPEVKAPS
jgi:tetratricopeptide (TPR) repeat protein